MIKCTVKNHYTALLVTFEDKKTLLIQPDYEQLSFAIDCGFIDKGADFTDIEECPDEYYDMAE